MQNDNINMLYYYSYLLKLYFSSLFEKWTFWLFILFDIFGFISIYIPLLSNKSKEVCFILAVVCFIIANDEIIANHKYIIIAKEYKKLTGHTFKINNISISKNNKMMLSSSDRVVIVWDIQDNRKNIIIARLQCPTWIDVALFTENDHSIIGIGGKGLLFKWSIFSDENFQPAQLETTESVALAISSDESLIATSGTNGVIHMWKYPTLELWSTYKMGNYRIRKLAFSPINNILAACDVSGKVIILNKTLNQHKTLFNHPENEPIRYLCFSQNGDKLAFVAGDGKPYIYNTNQEYIFSANKAHTDMCLCCCFSNDGNYLATGGQDNLIYIWKIKANKLHKHLIIKGHNDAVTSLIFDKGNNLYSASRDKKIKYWKINKLLY